MAGGKLEPQCVRLRSSNARSLNSENVIDRRAIRFEHIVRPKSQSGSLSKKSKQIGTRESTVVFSTTAMTVGNASTDLEATFDNDIIYECSRGLEPEILSALVQCLWPQTAASVFRLYISPIVLESEIRQFQANSITIPPFDCLPWHWFHDVGHSAQNACYHGPHAQQRLLGWVNEKQNNTQAVCAACSGTTDVRKSPNWIIRWFFKWKE